MATTIDPSQAQATTAIGGVRAPTSVNALTQRFYDVAVAERTFLMLLGVGFLAAGMFYENAAIARWLGFSFAAYAAVGNDSIQTIGTFIASNRNKPWWLLWLFMGGLFLLTATYSWYAYDGDVSYQRLATKGFSEAATSFSFLQVAAPLFLIILTRLRMPVSTTFLLLTSFTTAPSAVGKVLSKSISGYLIAFGIAFVVFIAVSNLMRRWAAEHAEKEVHAPRWRVAQWIISGVLWSAWLMQDAANVAVYLPRQLSGWEFIAFAGVIFLGLGLLFGGKGERIQKVVEEKSAVFDVRAATIIDFIYAIILVVFKYVSQIPMSTTWVFIGLLSGREIGMSVMRSSNLGFKGAAKMALKDLAFVGIGLAVSIMIAASVNDGFADAIRQALVLW